MTRNKRPFILLLTVTLIWALLAVARPMLRAGDGLVGEYFTNSEWIGPPAFAVVDPEPSTARMRQRWDGVPPEQFSVRSTGFLTVGRPGLYTFATTSDDGSELLVDNRLVVDNGGIHGAVTRSGSIRLDRGSHVVVLRYVQFAAASELEWVWSLDGGASAPVPAWALSQRPTRYAAAVNARIVEWGLQGFPIVIMLALLWYGRVSLRGREQAVGRWIAARGRNATNHYRNTASLVFSVFVFTAILFLPWPDAGQQYFSQAVVATIRNLNRTVVSALSGFDVFQADINTPQTGEFILPPRGPGNVGDAS